MTGLAEAALDYARRGWKVFPLHGIADGCCSCKASDCSSPAKHPLVRHGLREASADRAQVEAWWAQWPFANIGLITGATSGILVVDVDLPRALESLDRVVDRLPRTLAGLTGGGGVHLVYQSDAADLRNAVGRLPGIRGSVPGVDLRASGGYIVVPPSLHSSGNRYSWLDPNVPIAPAPSWLKQPKRSYTPIVSSAPKFTSGDGTAYGLAALRNECDLVRSAAVGTRNHQLYRSSRALARLVAAGELWEVAARSSLAQAGRCAGLGSEECYRTIASAFQRGSGGLESSRVTGDMPPNPRLRSIGSD